jgi:hypothetical protein
MELDEFFRELWAEASFYLSAVDDESLAVTGVIRRRNCYLRKATERADEVRLAL